VRPGRVRHEDLLQVVDDQQQGALPIVPRLGARPGQQVRQRSLDRLRPVPHLRQPGGDQVPGGPVGLHGRVDGVQDAQRAVVAVHHRDRVLRVPVGDPGGQAGLAQPARPVQQHPGPAPGAQCPQRLLQLQPTAHEHLRRRDRHLAFLAVQEHPRPLGRRHQRSLPGAPGQRAAAARPQPHPGQVPVRPDHRVTGGQQHPAGLPHRHRQVCLARQPPVQLPGERRRRPVIHRPVPADHRRHPGRHQRRRQRVRHQPGIPATRAALGASPRRQVIGRVRPGRGQACRHEHQPRPGAWPARHQQLRQFPRRHRAGAARVVLHHQHRYRRRARLRPPVVQPVARQVHYRQPPGPGQPGRQLPRVPGVLHQQVHPGFADGGQDCRLLRLEVQLMLPPWRRRHERQPQPEPIRRWPLPLRPQSADYAEPAQRVLRQKSTARGRQ
jgi:hypothetical protein